MIISSRFFKCFIISSLVFINLLILPLDLLLIDRGVPVVIFTFTITSFLFLIVCYFYIDFKKFPIYLWYFLIFFILIIIYPLFISFVVNEKIEYIASFLRFFSYFITVVSFFYLAEKRVLKLRDIWLTISIIIISCSIVGVIQIANGNLIYMNGAYRLSSVYGNTPAGLALLCLFSSVFYLSVIFFDSNNLSKNWSVFYLLLSIWMMYATQSRQALVSFILISFIVAFVRVKWHFRFFILLCCSVITYGVFWVVINTEIFPRLTDMLIRTGVDSSTQTRLDIINNSWNGTDSMEKVFGIGLGGFNQFYYSLTGDLGVAVHNDFFLFYFEGGVISITAYILFVLTTIIFWGRAYLTLNKIFFVPLCLFVTIYLLSFLNNVYYYPQVQILACAVFGYYLNTFKHHKRRISH